MQTQPFVNEPGDEDADARDLNHPLRIVIAYNEVPAGKRAMRVMSDLARGLGEAVEFQPLPWSFDLLADTDWAKVAGDDAVNADILIIATSSTDPRPPAVGRWAESAISRKQGTAAAVVALLGPEEQPDGHDSARLAAIRAAARQAGLDFFAPAPAGELDEAIARIHERAEMFTPVLEGISPRQHNAPRPRRNP